MMFLLLALLIPFTIFAQPRYIEITADQVNIRVGPRTSSIVVSKARKGDVFELHRKEGRWYKIRMFSVDRRYVHRSFAKATPYVVSIPNQVAVRRDIFQALMRAEDRAEAEADRKYPLEDGYGRPISANIEKNLDYMRLLNDRYKLRVMHRFKGQPPIHGIIITEGLKKNW